MKKFKRLSALLIASIMTVGTVSSISAGAFYSGYDSGYDGLYSLLKDAIAISRSDEGSNLFADGSACYWSYDNVSKYKDTTFIFADQTQFYGRMQVAPVYPNEISILPADKASYDTICNIMKENFPEIYVETYAEGNGDSDYLTLTGYNGNGKIPFEEAMKINITLSKSREIYDVIIKNAEISKFDFKTQTVSTKLHQGSITYYSNVNEETRELLSNYVSENLPDCHIEEQLIDNESWSDVIPNELNITVVPNGKISPEEHYTIANKIYKEIGLIPFTDNYESPSEISGSIIDMHNSINGDANNDGELSIADAVSIMQAIGNPDEYTLTPQGEFNADIAGNYDGLTNMDALAVQKRLLNLE